MENKTSVPNEKILQEISIKLAHIIERMEDQSSAIQGRIMLKQKKSIILLSWLVLWVVCFNGC